jgi:hypothetical protein
MVASVVGIQDCLDSIIYSEFVYGRVKGILRNFNFNEARLITDRAKSNRDSANLLLLLSFV